MKKFIGVCVLLATTFNVSFAQDCSCPNRGFAVSVVTPGDVFCGVGGYLCNVGRTVLSGAGKIVTAPFKADFIVPRVRRYRYVPGHIYREPADTLYDTPVDPYPPYAGPFPTQHLPSIPRHGGG
jgi:hypothetical protein